MTLQGHYGLSTTMTSLFLVSLRNPKQNLQLKYQSYNIDKLLCLKIIFAYTETTSSLITIIGVLSCAAILTIAVFFAIQRIKKQKEGTCFATLITRDASRNVVDKTTEIVLFLISKNRNLYQRGQERGRLGVINIWRSKTTNEALKVCIKTCALQSTYYISNNLKKNLEFFLKPSIYYHFCDVFKSLRDRGTENLVTSCLKISKLIFMKK